MLLNGNSDVAIPRTRFARTWCEAPAGDIPDRPLEPNHQRQAEEVAQGLQDKDRAKSKPDAAGTKPRRKPPRHDQIDPGL